MDIPTFGLGYDQLAGITLVFLGAQIYYWTTYTYWSRRNVKGPKPLPIFGNLLSFFRHSRQTLETEWVKKYGKIYGTYSGSKPFLTVADAEILRRISVKDFDKFRNRHFVGVPNKIQSHMLLLMKDDHWRSTRAIITPTFSTSKMKLMLKKFNECSKLLLEECENSLHQDTGEGVIDLRKVFGGHIMSCAMSAFYGIEPKRENYQMLIDWSDKNRIASEQTVFRLITYSLLPWEFLRLIDFPLFTVKQMEFFLKASNKIIETRKKSPAQYKDFLQLLLDARADDSEDQVESTENQAESHHAADIGALNNGQVKEDQESSNRRLSTLEVSMQTMMFLMVSTETTLSLVAHTIYLLAHHQDVQDRLFEELEQFKDKPLEYEDIYSLQYLDCVISESLRLLTPAISLDRLAEEDYHIEEYNITIPKGTIINLAFYAILRDPDYWPDPEKFDPERFKPENKDKIVPGSYCPFGIGPKACIGYRFALLEAKLSIIKLITTFHFDKASGTKYPPEEEKHSFVLNIYKDLLVTIRKRN